MKAFRMTRPPSLASDLGYTDLLHFCNGYAGCFRAGRADSWLRRNRP